MTSGKPKSLLSDEYLFEKTLAKKSYLKLYLIFGICFLCTLVLSMFVVLMLTMARVKQLENEVENIKGTLANLNLLDNEFINTIIGAEYEDIPVDDMEDLEDDIILEPEENYIYFENDDQTNRNENNQTENSRYESPMNLTKEGKESVRIKRDIVAATQDGVVINSEPYAERKAKNNTTQYTVRGKSVTAFPAKPSSIGSQWPIHPQSYYTPSSRRYTQYKPSTKAPPRVYYGQSRVMHRTDKSKAFRQIVKKSALKSGDSYQDESIATSSPDFVIVRDEGFAGRRYRQRSSNLETLDEGHYRTGRIKPLPAIHYNGDTSKYVVGQHPNYLGNGHIRHHQRTFTDWKSSGWVETLEMDSHFFFNDGYVTIKESGLYLVYSQIYYLDEHDVAGYRVFKNNEMILQCTLTIHSVARTLKGNTCYTGGVEHFSEGDRVSLADITEGRLSLFEPGKSFFNKVFIL
nr:uncharacterized protein LOC111505750 [Leptinotarsa decemlineata]